MKWISIEDKLPDLEQPVLIFFKDPYAKYDHNSPMEVAYMYKSYMGDEIYWNTGIDITHWMELPEAPEPSAHFSGCQIIHRIRNNCWNCKGMFDRGICDRGDDCDRKVKLEPECICVEGCTYKKE
jgi:hypothetical protein